MPVQIGSEVNGMILNCVQIVEYNKNGFPVVVRKRGRTQIPFIGGFNLKTDYHFKYAGKRLKMVTERNMNVDTLLINLAIGNVVTIERVQRKTWKSHKSYWICSPNI